MKLFIMLEKLIQLSSSRRFCSVFLRIKVSNLKFLFNFSGIKLYGCPFSIRGDSTNTAFQMSTEELKSKWEKIPFDTNILLTHTPPYGINDLKKLDPEPQGCKNLLKEVTERVKPKLHLFGHIHGRNGSHKIGETMFVNAAIKRFGSNFCQPIVFDYQL